MYQRSFKKLASDLESDCNSVFISFCSNFFPFLISCTGLEIFRFLDGVGLDFLVAVFSFLVPLPLISRVNCDITLSPLISKQKTLLPVSQTPRQPSWRFLKQLSPKMHLCLSSITQWDTIPTVRSCSFPTSADCDSLTNIMSLSASLASLNFKIAFSKSSLYAYTTYGGTFSATSIQPNYYIKWFIFHYYYTWARACIQVFIELFSENIMLSDGFLF